MKGLYSSSKSEDMAKCPIFLATLENHTPVVFMFRKCKFSCFSTFIIDNMRGSRKLCQRGSNSDNVLFFSSFSMRGKRIQITIKAGQHRPASETPFKWRFAGGPKMAQQ